MPEETLSALTPFNRGRFSVPNRVAFTATVNNLGRNREITPELIAFYEARAEGGAGLIITEGLSVHPTSHPNGTVPLAYDRDLIPGFTQLSEAVHAHNRPILGQLWHVGRQALWNPGLQPWAPSAGRDPYSGSTPHQMSDTEILEVIDGFAVSARNLELSGFDGVEIHGAHGYLVTQFLSPWSNQRDDRWGGSVRNRTRFLTELIAAIRKVCSPQFVIGLKLSAHEYVEGGLDLNKSQEIVSVIGETAPVEYLAVSQANFSPSLEYHVPDLSFEDVPFLDLAKGVREVAGSTPVMALAKVPDLATATELIDAGHADLVGMSRPWLADPRIISRFLEGETPRPCTYCNTCWNYIHTGRAVTCIYAPETGRELEYKAEAKKAAPKGGRLHVIGAGIAGLEAARVAADRGYEVDIYDVNSQSGGRLTTEAAIPGRERMGVAAQWLDDAVTTSATLHLETEVTAETVSTWDSNDEVIVATGAEPVVDALEGLDNAYSLAEAWEARNSLVGPVFIIDEIEDEPVYAIAVALAREGHDISLVTRRDAFARTVAYVSRIGILRRLDEAGIPLHAQLVPVRADNGVLVAKHVFSELERPIGPIGTIVRAGPFEAKVPEINHQHTVVGDASAPRPYEADFHEAHRVAVELGTR